MHQDNSLNNIFFEPYGNPFRETSEFQPGNNTDMTLVMNEEPELNHPPVDVNGITNSKKLAVTSPQISEFLNNTVD